MMLQSWAELVPQAAIFLAIVAAVVALLGAVGALLVLVFRSLSKLLETMTKPTQNGERESRLETIEADVAQQGGALLALKDDIAEQGGTQVSHGKMIRKQFAAMRDLRRGQNDILEHITQQPSSYAPLPEDIDDVETDRFDLPGEVADVPAGE